MSANDADTIGGSQAARCQTLRHKLTSLHYFQPLGAESCALVEKLLDDVLKSVENFEILAKRYADLVFAPRLNRVVVCI